MRCLLLAAALLTGCGGYASTSEAFRGAMRTGQLEPALARVNEALGVDSAEALPKDPEADTPLLLLERGTILQAMERYELSARDFQVADKSLDVLDLTNDTMGDIGKYIFSDDATQYRSPPHEKLLLNTINMLNYLARGDASGAKVEARRFTINRKYLDEHELDEGDARGMLALGSYLAGFAYEVDREPGPAMRHYADAYTSGGLPGLLEAARALAARTGEKDERFDLGEDLGEPTDEEYAELLVVVQTGMAPYKIPKRLPIGAAVVIATRPGPGARLTPQQRASADRFAAKGLLKWVNYPALRKSSPGGRVDLRVDGQRADAPVALDVESKVVAQDEKVRGTVIAACITRLLTRAVAGELSDAATRKAGGGGIAGLLVGLAVEGALTAADTPDTRSWVTLPAKIHLRRLRVAPGEHTVSVMYRGRERRKTVDLKAGGWAVVNLSDLR